MTRHTAALTLTLLLLSPALAMAQDTPATPPSTPAESPTPSAPPSEYELIKRVQDAEAKLEEQNDVMVRMAVRLVAMEKREKARERAQKIDALTPTVDAKLPTIVFFGPAALAGGAAWIAQAANNEQSLGRAAGIGALSGLVGGALMGVGYKVDDPMTIVAGGILTVAAVIAPFALGAAQ